MKLGSSSIFICDLRVYAFHGVLPQERQVGAEFIVSLRVHYNICMAMESDDVADTLNYAELCQLIEKEMAVSSNLLEHVAGRIGKAIMECYPQVEDLDLSIIKKNPPMGVPCEGAGVEIHLINDKTQS